MMKNTQKKIKLNFIQKIERQKEGINGLQSAIHENINEELNEQKMMGIIIEKNAGYSLPLKLAAVAAAMLDCRPSRRIMICMFFLLFKKCFCHKKIYRDSVRIPHFVEVNFLFALSLSIS